MANNFFNKIVKNVSADATLPSEVYAVPASKKTIVIELDVANRSTSSQTISVEIEDYSARAANAVKTCVDAAISSNTIVTGSAHGFATGDRVLLVNTGTSGIQYNSAELSKVAWWFVIYVNATSFKLATSHTNATAGTFITLTGDTDAAGSDKDDFQLIPTAYIVRDAPIPIGGALKVIAGQKLVLEAQDSLEITASTASSVDAIASILEDVS